MLKKTFTRTRKTLHRMPALLAISLIFFTAIYHLFFNLADLATWPSLERFLVAKQIKDNEDHYLIALRDSHLGCQTIRYRHPNLIFVGDSHSYAGYDYKLLQNRLPETTVGNCALAGMFPENLVTFLKVASQQKLIPEHVVFGVQPRMFWDVEERERQILQANQEITKLNTAKSPLMDILKGEASSLARIRKGADIKESQDKLSEALKSLSDRQVDDFLASPSAEELHPIKYWMGNTAGLGLFEGNKEVIHQICNLVHEHNVKLGIVYVPESKWMNSLYSSLQQEEFLRTMALFRNCADWIDLSYFENEGGPNRWFINRNLLEHYPYTAWTDPALAVSWVQEKPVERKWQFFDPDHMNSFGATQFSIYMSDKLNEWVSD